MTFLLKLLSTQMEFCINLLLKWKHKNIYRLTLISIISFSDNFSWESFYNLKRRFPLSITPLSEHPTLKIQVKDLKYDAHQSSWGDWDAGRTEFGIYISLMKIIHYIFYSVLHGHEQLTALETTKRKELHRHILTGCPWNHFGCQSLKERFFRDTLYLTGYCRVKIKEG